MMLNASHSSIDHPGSFIVEELNARSWSQSDLAYILDMDTSQLNRLVKGTANITPDTAAALGEAFDMPADFFLSLQNMFDLQNTTVKPGVRTRASWLSVFPVREMIKRGWIEDAEPSLLNLQMMRFFGTNRIEDIPFVGDAVVFAHAAKKSIYSTTTPIQYAWLNRVRILAERMSCPLYSSKTLQSKLSAIRAHMLDREDFCRIPEILEGCGVRFVLVEALPGSKIDGVCLWLEGQPVIGMTLRLDRPDNFCFVLRHEIEHVLREDGRQASFSPVDEFDGVENTDIDVVEQIANEAAAEFCVPRALLNSFIERKGPLISERDVLSFAARVSIHPAVVIGQIQNQTKRFGWLRKYQANIRDTLTDWKVTDGWGIQAPSGL